MKTINICKSYHNKSLWKIKKSKYDNFFKLTIIFLNHPDNSSSLARLGLTNTFSTDRKTLTWWIPRTACLIEVGGVGWSRGRIPSWITFKRWHKHTHHTPSQHTQTHTCTKVVRRWQPLKKGCLCGSPRSAERVVHTDTETRLPTRGKSTELAHASVRQLFVVRGGRRGQKRISVSQSK